MSGNEAERRVLAADAAHRTKDEVKVGQIWTARISGRLVEVQIVAAEYRDGFRRLSPGGYSRPGRQTWEAKNLSTGKTITIKSATKLRRLVKEAE